jgi:putative transposase
MNRKPYPNDLTDQEWAILEPLIPAAKQGGRPRTVNMREVLNALKIGCQWDHLPHDFPPKGTVYHSFNTGRKDGTWERMNDTLREPLRQELGRKPHPVPGASIVKPLKRRKRRRKRL